ncbi:hypothetical protein B0T14DRAFT_497460 [Immersiella caudata]|uniref:Uncharacterized protein n=1 Tax=Immersiella caudata TaxID=314043 RepID=A0AA40BWD8_9PEZI|nr:hypothetical protein B0T14DRAFT_497460 [Immersiella caudata]
MHCLHLLPMAGAWAVLFQVGHALPAGEFNLGEDGEADVPTQSNVQILDPIPRYIWDRSVPESIDNDADDDDVPLANLSLTTHEQILWWNTPPGGLDPTLPPNAPNTGMPTHPPHHTTLVSMVTWASQDQRIVDMAKFAWSLKDVNCTGSNMWIQFLHIKNFYAAQQEWEWLNYNTMNSFILVGDQHKCGRDWSPQPWVVSRLQYHAKNLTITMRAEKSSWRKVADMYTLDFGMTGPERMPVNSRAVAKNLAERAWFDWDVSFDPTFRLSLASRWPRTFLNKTFGPKNEANLNVICADCGIQGGLTFAGHIEGSLLGGIDHLVLSATPDDLSANLALEATFKGKFSFKNTDWARGEEELFVIPLPYSFVIPKVLTFGPTAKLIGGWELNSIEGHATVTTGISAAIPPESLAKVDVIAKDVEVRGWGPEFEVQPPKLESAGITAKGSVYGKLAVALSLEVMDEAGINTDVYLKLPISITAEAGYNEAGFCPGNPSPWGLSLESELGVVLGLEAWKEVKGDKDILFDVVFFQDLDVADFPPLCLSLGSLSGTCPSIKADDILDWYENEVEPNLEDEEEDDDDGDDDGDETYYSMWCDPKGKGDSEPSDYPIILKPYPKPGTLIKRAGVPIMKPLFDACEAENAGQCTPNLWDIDPTIKPSPGGSAAPNVKTIFTVESNKANSEHVYEGQWLRQYYDYLYKTYYNKNAGDKPPDPADEPHPQCKLLAEHFKIKDSLAPHDSLLLSLGHRVGDTADPENTMTLFPGLENGIKHRVFRPNYQADAGFGKGSVKYEGDSGYDMAACSLGRLVIVCRYLRHEATLKAMGVTLGRIDAALNELDKTPPSNKPGDMTVTYRAAHQMWFETMWKDGIVKLKNTIVAGAEWLKAKEDKFKDLPPDTKKKVEDIINNREEELSVFCPSEDFVWPS